jgi:hypothetical protein
MQINLKKNQRQLRIKKALKNNLKKRKIFQKQNQKKIKNEHFVRPLD